MLLLTVMAESPPPAAADAPVDQAAEPIAVSIEDGLPYGQAAVDYFGTPTGDAGSRLNRKLAAGEATLRYEEKSGYLRSLLDALDVPVESQLLVFSKTALNPRLVEPANPRAVYFNDEVTVGWVPGADALEVTALDPAKGPIFYILKQHPDANPALTREERCLACHAGTTTLQVPGLMLRSFLTDQTGKPRVGYSRTTHDIPLPKRWGGWYVTGTHGDQHHSGNIFGDERIAEHRADPSIGGNVVDLKPFLDVERYETPHSDIVAHLVIDHQMHGINLLTRAAFEERLGRRSDVEERLVRYLLFLDEPPLGAEIAGGSGFAEVFQRRGPRDSQGRSLRALELKSRLFRYRLSYLIYSPLFDGLPEAVRGRVYRRVWEALTGAADLEGSDVLPVEERTAIREIVRETKSNLPEYWK